MVVTANPPKSVKTGAAPIVEISHLCKTYRLAMGKEIQAVSNLTFDIQRGETFAIVGPNGSGKTTTMKMLLGMLFPTSGSINIFGGEPGEAEAQKRVGYLPEAPYFYEFLNGRELLDYYGKLCEIPDDVRKTRIEALLKMVDLFDRGADMPIRVYSRGMRQRIGIAQCMINEPDLLILDEPTNGLDPIGTVQVRQFILEQKKQKRTILLCSHLLSEVEAVADRVAILNRGRVMAIGHVNELVPESRQWQILACGLTKDNLAAFKSAGFLLETHGDIATIRSDSQEAIFRGINMLHDMKGQLIEVSKPQPTLEEQFLKAVGEDTLQGTAKKLKK